MEQFEQLLTCAICLDRYRNPKLLPCQHSFCMEPCMDGLVDYVRRQVKCPECRAEHRIPYQGVQGYPTNVTLQRFLELHIEITGEQPDPTSGQIMKRCAVCTEKAYCSFCLHCSKDVCQQCKAAHMDILRREITRINNQVRRSLHRLEDMLSMVEKNTLALQQNCTSVSEEVDEIYRRLSKALKDRTEYLRSEIDRYLSTELRNLMSLKENLDVEIANIQSNCDLADKHMQSEEVEWEDCELLDTKEIFLKTVDFIRNFEAEMGDYNRRVRFQMAHDPNQLVMHVGGYGELNISMPHQFVGVSSSTSQLLQAPSSNPGLMRSKSDHRLASQYRQQEERGDDSGRLSPLGSRKFGERYQRGYQRERDYDYEEDTRSSARSRLRSRFRHHGGDTDSDNEGGRTVRFSDNTPSAKERDRVLDTEDVVRGPLSGITRLYDCPRVMKKLQESQIKKDKPEPPPQEKPKFQPPPKRPTQVSVTQRQVSEEDEITKIKRQMKNAPGEVQSPQTPTVVAPTSTATNTSAALVERETSVVGVKPGCERVAALRREDDPQAPSSPTSSRSSPSSDHSVNKPTTPPVSQQVSQSAQSSSSESEDSAGGSGPQSPSTVARKTSVPSRPQPQSPSRTGTTTNSTGARTTVSTPPTVEKTTKEEEESSSETESSSEESESEDEPTPAVVTKPAPPPPTPAPVASARSAENPSDIGPLLARAAQARDTSRKSSRDESYTSTPSSQRYGTQTETSTPSSYRTSSYSSRQNDDTPSYRSRTSATTNHNNDDDTPSSRFSSSTGFTSRFLNKSKSTAAVSPEEEDPGTTRRFGTNTSSSTSTANQSPRSRYTALKERRARLARSRSSHNVGGDDDDDEDVVAANSPAAYLAGKYGTSSPSSTSELSRSRSTHAIKSREPSPEPTRTSSNYSASSSSGGGSGAGGEKDGAALSSWARYLKNKYGARGKDGGATSTSAAANSRRLSLGLPLRGENSDEDQKNSPGSPTSPTQHPLHQGFGVNSGTRWQYAAKRRQVFSVGSRGSEPGCFTWPRGVATGPENSIVVADSSNHRVQVFDSNGIFMKEFGGYGNGEGEFDCLAGVAVNRIGQFIIADRYNHRIQVMDPSGRFLRAFGSQGTTDGKFNYPWGVTTDALGFIYVCDKENHRVQVFQSDGTFVGKFGSHGSKVGQLDHPHYIAVSNTNRVIVSDSNNHRIQIFDVNGRVLSSFGTEGSEEGQFKFPRGVAVDDQGYILVGDSGNNRIQIFTSEGGFIRAFGCWGSGEAEFKGLEGVAVMSNSNILVCDRENHRIQVF